MLTFSYLFQLNNNLNHQNYLNIAQDTMDEMAADLTDIVLYTIKMMNKMQIKCFIY